MDNVVQNNPLLTREDVERAAADMIKPLLPLLSLGHARLHLGETGAVYSTAIAEMEAFARPLWAIIPMLIGDCPAVAPLWEAWRKGIINGVNPAHTEYWGAVEDYDQRLVEMAVFGMGMALAPQQFFFSLPDETRKQLYQWLDQINHHDMPKNNWIFFRVLVNIGFRVCGLAYSQAQLEEDIAQIETHYEGDGWYFDYPNQRDYYTLWAFHYYSLVYAVVMKEADPERAKRYRERAALIAGDFACWFDENGSALPYGRSLTYRFAQSAFFAMAAVAGVTTEAVDYGVMKHLLLQNLRQWFHKPIFTRDGVLTIGYEYPNLLMAEGYNGPGSPYWAMKTFACLALPKNHPFWMAQEKPFAGPARKCLPHARMVITRNRKGDHVIGYTAGNHAHEHAHDEAKYEKFAYSTVFGFSVPKAGKLLKDGAFDSVLAVSLDGDTYHPRYGCSSYEVTEGRIESAWSPFPQVRIQTTIIPLADQWHLRIHHLQCDCPVWIAEGGFALAREGNGTVKKMEDDQKAEAKAPWGVSVIRALQGYERGTVITPEPNTNLMSPRTALPTLLAKLPAGKTMLACAVYASPRSDAAMILPKEANQYAKLG